MQLAAPEASNLGEESKATRELYGAGDPNPLLAAYAKNCMLARRLVERGARFIQLYCGSRASGVDGLLNWDAHKTLKGDYERHCPILDQPTAALLKDLKSRGLLDDTLVLWTTEFGRMPTHQAGTIGRDHNPDGFTVWMAGAGVKGGASYGATDEFGRRAAENVSTIYDFHATVPASARSRPREADLLPQRHRATSDRRARPRDPTGARLIRRFAQNRDQRERPTPAAPSGRGSFGQYV